MPKLFPISIEVEEVALGRVLRSLNTMAGVVRLHLNLTQDKAPQQISHDADFDRLSRSSGEAEHPEWLPPATKWRTDGRINSRGVKTSKNIAYRAIADVLLKTPAHNKILSAALQRVGVTHPNAVHGHLHRMNALKLIKRTAPGTYRLTEKGEKLFSRNEEPKRITSPSQFKIINNHAGVRLLILKTLHERGSPVSGQELTKVIMDNGFSPKNLSTTGMKMRNEGLFTMKDGFYSLTNAGRNIYENPPPQRTDNPNPTTQQEMTTNG